MDESSHNTVWWWIIGALVVVLSGVGAYIYAIQSPTAPVVATNGVKSQDSSATVTQKPIIANTAITSSELDIMASEIGGNLTSLDSNLSDLDRVEATEEAPSL